MAIELVQAQPISFGVGYFSGRIWINSVGMSPVYFGNFSVENTLFSDTNSFTLDLCGASVSGSNTLDSTLYGDFDISDFVWLDGVQSAIADSSSNCGLFI